MGERFLPQESDNTISCIKTLFASLVSGVLFIRPSMLSSLAWDLPPFMMNQSETKKQMRSVQAEIEGLRRLCRGGPQRESHT